MLDYDCVEESEGATDLWFVPSTGLSISVYGREANVVHPLRRSRGAPRLLPGVERTCSEGTPLKICTRFGACAGICGRVSMLLVLRSVTAR